MKLTAITTLILAAGLMGGCDRKKDDGPLTSSKSIEETKHDVDEARDKLAAERADQAEALAKSNEQGREAAEAQRDVNLAENDLAAKVDELGARAQARMRELDGRADALKGKLAANAATVTADTRKSVDEALSRYQVARTELLTALGELKGSSTATYGDLQDRIEDRIEDMQKAYEDAFDVLDYA